MTDQIDLVGTTVETITAEECHNCPHWMGEHDWTGDGYGMCLDEGDGTDPGTWCQCPQYQPKEEP